MMMMMMMVMTTIPDGSTCTCLGKPPVVPVRRFSTTSNAYIVCITYGCIFYCCEYLDHDTDDDDDVEEEEAQTGKRQIWASKQGFRALARQNPIYRG